MKDGGHSLVKIRELRLPNLKNIENNDFLVFGNLSLKRKIISSRQNIVPELSDEEVSYLVDFLHSLTERQCLDMNKIIPKEVYSGIDIHN
ncbi:MAG: hypothetical protein NXH75_07050 [Halobacteriovoraceae bacterium]|nr:hypothetical protein [Halobacteriovoraceae bacterium]